MKNKILENWKFHRGLSLDILKSLSDEQLGFTVGENMGSLGEQFRHMARVQVQYTEAIQNKKVGKIGRKIDLDVAKSKDDLIKLWEEIEKNMTDIVGSLSEEEIENFKIDWNYWHIPEMDLVEHLTALTDHQNLHNGQIVVYLKTHSISFPKSWSAWGL
jgi:uncharacterized damage-inducible protein DinB